MNIHHNHHQHNTFGLIHHHYLSSVLITFFIHSCLCFSLCVCVSSIHSYILVDVNVGKSVCVCVRCCWSNIQIDSFYLIKLLVVYVPICDIWVIHFHCFLDVTKNLILARFINACFALLCLSFFYVETKLTRIVFCFCFVLFLLQHDTSKPKIFHVFVVVVVID